MLQDIWGFQLLAKPGTYFRAVPSTMSMSFKFKIDKAKPSLILFLPVGLELLTRV